MNITEVDTFYYKKGVYEIEYENFNSNYKCSKIIHIDENFSQDELKKTYKKIFNIDIYKIKKLRHLENVSAKKSKTF